MSRELDSVVGTIEPSSVIDVRAIGLALRNRRRVWLVPPLLALVGLGLFASTATPRYTAEARVLIDPTKAAGGSIETGESVSSGPVGLSRSPEIANRAIRDLQLQGNAEFDPLAGGMNPFRRALVVTGLLPDPARDTAQSRLVRGFERKLASSFSRESGLLSLSFTSRDPALAARAANEVARLTAERVSAAERPASDAAARVVSSATPPRSASSPNMVLVAILGALATLLASIGWVIASELRSGRAIIPGTPLPASARDDESVEATEGESAPRRRASDLFGEGASPTGRADPQLPLFGAAAPSPLDETDEDRTMQAGQSDRRPAEDRQPRRASRRAIGRAARIAEDHDDVVIGPVSPSLASSGDGEGSAIARVRSVLAAARAYLGGFGRSASDSRSDPFVDRNGEGAPASRSQAKSASRPSGIGWDLDDADEAVDASHVAAPPAAASPASGQSVGAIAARVVDAHVPGRGLHIVGTNVEDDGAASVHLALGRLLSEKGRAIVVDLNTMPMQLASLAPAPDEGDGIAALRGLSELLAGEASFAEVIHRDRATRLHFIPTGMREADFRDFDLVLDALSETYDFIVLLTPSFPQSEIAKVMAPYADFVILGASERADGITIARLEAELSGAGARDILVAFEFGDGLGHRQVA